MSLMYWFLLLFLAADITLKVFLIYAAARNVKLIKALASPFKELTGEIENAVREFTEDNNDDKSDVKEEN